MTHSSEACPDGQANTDHRSAAGGGAVRGAIVALSRTKLAAARVIIGRLPRKPPKLHTIGTSADRLGNVGYFTKCKMCGVDVDEEVAKGTHLIAKYGQVLEVVGAIKDEGAHTRNISSLFRTALPSIAKSVISGTVLFLTYDEVNKRLQPFDGLDEAVPHPMGHIFRAVGAGSAAGMAHAGMTLCWEALLARSMREVQGRVGRTLGSHCLAHAALFGSYEGVKVPLVGWAGGLEGAAADYGRLCAVAVAGGGAVQEGLGQAAARGWGGGARGLRWQSILWAAPPAALGFVAFEFAEADPFAEQQP